MKSIHKPQDGKLIRISLDTNQGLITRVQVCGDFFLHPEESLESIEAALVGMPIDEGLIQRKIEQVAVEHGIQMLGVSAQSLAFTIMKAARWEPKDQEKPIIRTIFCKEGKA